MAHLVNFTNTRITVDSEVFNAHFVPVRHLFDCEDECVIEAVLKNDHSGQKRTDIVEVCIREMSTVDSKENALSTFRHPLMTNLVSILPDPAVGHSFHITDAPRGISIQEFTQRLQENSRIPWDERQMKVRRSVHFVVTKLLSLLIALKKEHLNLQKLSNNAIILIIGNDEIVDFRVRRNFLTSKKDSFKTNLLTVAQLFSSAYANLKKLLPIEQPFFEACLPMTEVTLRQLLHTPYVHSDPTTWDPEDSLSMSSGSQCSDWDVVEQNSDTSSVGEMISPQEVEGVAADGTNIGDIVSSDDESFFKIETSGIRTTDDDTWSVHTAIELDEESALEDDTQSESSNESFDHVDDSESVSTAVEPDSKDDTKSESTNESFDHIEDSKSVILADEHDSEDDTKSETSEESFDRINDSDSVSTAVEPDSEDNTKSESSDESYDHVSDTESVTTAVELEDSFEAEQYEIDESENEDSESSDNESLYTVKSGFDSDDDDACLVSTAIEPETTVKPVSEKTADQFLKLINDVVNNRNRVNNFTETTLVEKVFSEIANAADVDVESTTVTVPAIESGSGCKSVNCTACYAPYSCCLTGDCDICRGMFVPETYSPKTECAFKHWHQHHAKSSTETANESIENADAIKSHYEKACEFATSFANACVPEITVIDLNDAATKILRCIDDLIMNAADRDPKFAADAKHFYEFLNAAHCKAEFDPESTAARSTPETVTEKSENDKPTSKSTKTTCCTTCNAPYYCCLTGDCDICRGCIMPDMNLKGNCARKHWLKNYVESSKNNVVKTKIETVDNTSVISDDVDDIGSEYESAASDNDSFASAHEDAGSNFSDEEDAADVTLAVVENEEVASEEEISEDETQADSDEEAIEDEMQASSDEEVSMDETQADSDEEAVEAEIQANSDEKTVDDEIQADYDKMDSDWDSEEEISEDENPADSDDEPIEDEIQAVSDDELSEDETQADSDEETIENEIYADFEEQLSEDETQVDSDEETDEQQVDAIIDSPNDEPTVVSSDQPTASTIAPQRQKESAPAPCTNCCFIPPTEIIKVRDLCALKRIEHCNCCSTHEYVAPLNHFNYYLSYYTQMRADYPKFALRNLGITFDSTFDLIDAKIVIADKHQTTFTTYEDGEQRFTMTINFNGTNVQSVVWAGVTYTDASQFPKEVANNFMTLQIVSEAIYMQQFSLVVYFKHLEAEFAIHHDSQIQITCKDGLKFNDFASRMADDKDLAKLLEDKHYATAFEVFMSCPMNPQYKYLEIGM